MKPSHMANAFGPLSGRTRKSCFDKNYAKADLNKKIRDDPKDDASDV